MKKSLEFMIIAILFLSLFVLNVPKVKAEEGLAATWGGNSYDYGRSVAIDSSNNVYVVGETQSFGEGGTDVLLLKFNLTSNLIWQKTWGGSNDDGGLATAVDSFGNVYVTGYTRSFGAGDEDAFILKLNSSGDVMWQKTWGGGWGDRGMGITVDSLGNVYVTGWSLSYGTSTYGWTTYSSVFLLKINSSGDLEWQRTWEEQYVPQCGNCLATDPLGNVYVAGYFGGFILKYNSTGSLMWQRIWGETNDQCFGLCRDSSGNLYIIGQTPSSGAGGHDAFVLKLSSAGGLVWQKTWGGTSDDQARGIALDDTSERIYVTGFTNSFGTGNYSVFVLTLNFAGGLEQQRIISGGSHDEGCGVALDSHGNPIVTGYVSESPPYNVESSSYVLGTSSFSLTTSSIPTQSPTAALGVATGITSIPLGNTTYSGNTDVLLLVLTAVIPEYPSFIILPAFVLTTLAIFVVWKRKRLKFSR